jgi:photosystem II stability/assembly factor-like uncharacterized protein
MVVRAILFTICVTAAAQSWTPQTSGTTASLRGVSAVSPEIAWASGTKGAVLKTIDGGSTWRSTGPAGVADLDFRGVKALDESIVYLLSSGPGPQSRIYKTTDGGDRWALLYPNTDRDGYWDAIAFWDSTHGIVLGDPVNGRFTILTTSDGTTWQSQKGPVAEKDEGAFAASGTCLFTRGAREAWFATGGPGGGRVFHTSDGGVTWSVSKTPARHDSPNAGIFSLAFSDARHGVAVGGDYSKPGEAPGNVVITEDGGKTWTAPASAPSGYRSAVTNLADADLWLAVGTSGSDVSRDGGKTWKKLGDAGYNAMSFIAHQVGWAVGPNGAIARFDPGPPVR